MNGQLIVKVRYGDDIRKAVVPSSKMNSLAAITNWIAETFNLDGTRNNLLLKYKDEDGDLITLINDDDVQLALSTESKLYLHVNVCEDVSAASNSGSGRASPTKDESVALIHPSTHDESQNNLSSMHSPPSNQQRKRDPSVYANEDDTKIFLTSMRKTPLQHKQQPPSSDYQQPKPDSSVYANEDDTRIFLTSMEKPLLQKQQPPSSAYQQRKPDPAVYANEDDTRIFLTSMETPLLQKQQLPSSAYQQRKPDPSVYANEDDTKIFLSALSLSQQRQRPPEAQKRFDEISLHERSSHDQQQPRQSHLSAAQSQERFAQPSMNGMPPQQQQMQQQPYSSQTQQGYAAPMVNGLPPPPTSMNGVPPPPQQRQQQPYPSQSGSRQGYGSPMNGNPSMNTMPLQPQQTGAALFTQNFGPPPSSSIPGLGNPFARQQLYQRPGQR